MSGLELVQDAGTLCPREKSSGICQGLKKSLAVQFLQVLLTLLFSMDSKGRARLSPANVNTPKYQHHFLQQLRFPQWGSDADCY